MKVNVVALSSYEQKEEKFAEEVIGFMIVSFIDEKKKITIVYIDQKMLQPVSFVKIIKQLYELLSRFSINMELGFNVGGTF